jgi:hypothetical protein
MMRTEAHRSRALQRFRRRATQGGYYFGALMTENKPLYASHNSAGGKFAHRAVALGALAAAAGVVGLISFS